MPTLFRAALAALSLAAVLGLPATVRAADPPKVAIIVGPVASLTPTYLALAERAASTAERHGATVARAYSPHATPAAVLAAVEDANIVIYFGHGYGHPSPYGGLNTAKQNGWGLQGPAARGTHGDGGAQIAYYGEDWIVANARPAPGFVMIYSNTCYAPGASEPGHPDATATQAAQRVAYYSRSTFSLGGSAYFATDFDYGAADLVERLLGNRGGTYAQTFVSDARYVPSGLTIQPHHFSAGQQIWLHRSKYTDGPPNYWYAFAGDPNATPMRSWDRAAPTASLLAPHANGADVAVDSPIRLQFSETVTGVSSSTIWLRAAGGDPLAATVSHDPQASVATIVPQDSLALSGRYEIVIGQGVADLAGRPLPPVTWAFSTRIDADPLSAPLPVVLESGSHELVRFAEDGSVAETRSLDVRNRLWLTADLRARLPAQTGSWLRIQDAELAGWWVAESGAAHALRQTEEAVLSPEPKVALDGDRRIVGFGPNGPQATDLSLHGIREVTVDRRRIFDGRTYLRLADSAGAWIEVDPQLVATEAVAQRVLGSEQRPTVASLSLAPGERVAFRFDAAGRVVERRSLADASRSALTTAETRLIGGMRFHVIAGGELAGWALADDGGIRILTGTLATPLD